MGLVNPFRPTAGMTPPMLVGRESVLDDFVEGIAEGPGAPARLMRITGPRGSGKTVLLTELGDIARERRWGVIDLSGQEALCDTFCQRARHLAPHVTRATVKASLPLVQGEVELAGASTDMRDVFERTTKRLTEGGAGLLITIDEVQDASRDEMRIIAANVQYMIRARQNIALVFAGLTTGVLDLLNGKALTFLRRAKAEELDSIPIAEVAESFAQTFEASGLHISGTELESAAQATGGYAYLIQLVGYHIWRAARRHADASSDVTHDDVQRGVANAMREFERAVIETALAPLTKPAIEYLLAMADLGDVCATADVAKGMGKPASYAASYRRILIKNQLIEATAPGYVAFSIPYLRQYLLGNRAEILARYGM